MMRTKDQNATLGEALASIRVILEAVNRQATPDEKIVRIGWVIASLPSDLRNEMISEIQNRALIGFAKKTKPTDWGN